MAKYIHVSPDIATSQEAGVMAEVLGDVNLAVGTLVVAYSMFHEEGAMSILFDEANGGTFDALVLLDDSREYLSERIGDPRAVEALERAGLLEFRRDGSVLRVFDDIDINEE